MLVPSPVNVIWDSPQVQSTDIRPLDAELVGTIEKTSSSDDQLILSSEVELGMPLPLVSLLPRLWILDSGFAMNSTRTEISFPDGAGCSLETGIFINNQFVPAVNGESFETTDPYTQKTICTVSRGIAKDIDRAVYAATEAFAQWKKTTSQDRGRLLAKLADLVDRDADTLAKLEVLVFSDD
jgi:hypothetical protein